MSIKNLLYWSYWFNQPYIARGWVLWVWLLSFLAFILAGLVLLLVRHFQADTTTRSVLKKFASCFLTMGIIALGWLFLRQERVLFLAWRFWLWFWFAIVVLWLAKILVYTIRRVPRIKVEHQARELKEKYLPKRA